MGKAIKASLIVITILAFFGISYPSIHDFFTKDRYYIATAYRNKTIAGKFSINNDTLEMKKTSDVYSEPVAVKIDLTEFRKLTLNELYTLKSKLEIEMPSDVHDSLDKLQPHKSGMTKLEFERWLISQRINAVTRVIKEKEK